VYPALQRLDYVTVLEVTRSLTAAISRGLINSVDTAAAHTCYLNIQFEIYFLYPATQQQMTYASEFTIYMRKVYIYTMFQYILFIAVINILS
jgi:hypothetical protein